LEKKLPRKDEKIKSLLKELSTSEGQKFSKHLQLLKNEGNIYILKPLADLMLNKEIKEQQEILTLFGDLNESAAVDEIVDILRDEKFMSVRQLILTAVWNSKLNYSNYLPEFIEIAVEGNFMEALECLTIMENMEGPFKEQHILEAQLHLKDYLEDPAPKETEKAKIISEIALILKDLSLFDEEDMSSYME
jgi:hypothetical protein